MNLLNRGIVSLALISMYKEPSHRSAMVNQALFGETYTITNIAEEWLEISLDDDAYRGWIPENQHISFDGKLTKPELLPLAVLSIKNLHLSIASRIQTEYAHTLIEEVKLTLPNFQSQKEKIKYYSSLYLNTPYLWGGKSIFGIDCSALVQQVYKLCEKDVPRDAYQQCDVSRKIPFEEREAGDLAFFEEKGRVTHVGILISKDKLIHASGYVREDEINEKGTKTRSLHAIGRVL